MSDNSTIEWTDASWNPVTGCSRVSPGCVHCYAERFAERFRGVEGHPYEMGFDLTLRYDRLELPLGWEEPRRIFVNSMSDLYHEQVPLDFIYKVFETMWRAERHTFQILTKRAQRLRELGQTLPWPPNVWQGVSVEREDFQWRIDCLRKVRAAVRFLSLEPLVGPLDNLDLRGIDWVIVGGESGPGARPMSPDWVTSIRDQCEDSGVPFFFKQWGGTNKHVAGRRFEGRTWDDFPDERIVAKRYARRRRGLTQLGVRFDGPPYPGWMSTQGSREYLRRACPSNARPSVREQIHAFSSR